MATEMLVGASS